MGSIVLYIIEWAFALLVLLAIYKAAFSGTTLHRFNRFYLLGATLLSALLPLVHVTIPDSTPLVNNLSIEETGFAQELSGTLTFMYEPRFEKTESVVHANKASLWAVMLVITYAVYVLTLIIGWSRGIIRARKFLRGKPRRRLSRTVWLVTHDEQYGPFSWMNYIVISDTESGFARRASLRHEYSHVRLLHSVDLIALLACTIVNPVCWLVLQEIKIVHEFEADNEVINRYGIRNSDYQKLLIMRTVGAEAYALASSFNLNIKKRIIMMNKKKTLKRRLIWLLLLIPLLGMTSVLFAHTEKSIGPDNILALSLSNDNEDKESAAESATFEVSGKVVDQDGNPIASADFTVMPDVSGLAVLAKCRSDRNGEFAYSTSKGELVTVSKQGYVPIKVSFEGPSSDLAITLKNIQIQSIVTPPAVEPADADNELQLVVTPQTVKAGDVIKGMVIDAQSGDPITMANVCEMDEKDHILAHGITDINGIFSIRIINPDDYLRISHEGYNEARRPVSNGNVSLTRAYTYDYNEITIFIQTQGLSAMILKFRHDETGDDECIVDLPRRPLELNELEDFLDTPDFVKEDIQQVTLMVWPDVPSETLNEVKTVLRKKQFLNVRYQNPSPLINLDHYSTRTEESDWIGVEVLPTASEQYVVECFGGDFTDAEPVKNLESAVKDLFEGKRKYFVIPYSEDNFKKVKEVIGQYPDKKVNWM